MAKFIRITGENRTTFVPVDNIAAILRADGYYVVHLKQHATNITQYKADNAGDIEEITTLLSSSGSLQ